MTVMKTTFHLLIITSMIMSVSYDLCDILMRKFKNYHDNASLCKSFALSVPYHNGQLSSCWM